MIYTYVSLAGGIRLFGWMAEYLGKLVSMGLSK